MIAKLLIMISGVVVAVVIQPVAAQQEKDVHGPAFDKLPAWDNLSAEAEADWEKRRLAIEKEIAELGEHPWAGDYCKGGGLSGLYLILAPTSGFAYMRSADIGVQDRNHGDVIHTDDGTLKLVFTFENAEYGFAAPEELVLIRWGERHYLVAIDDVLAFCNHVVSGTEPRNSRYGWHLLRRGDHEKPAKGLPEIPKRFRECVLAEPIEAQITAASDTEIMDDLGTQVFYVTPVTLNAGRADGIRTGTFFRRCEPSGPVISCSARVTSLDDHTSQANLTQIPMGKAKPPLPEVGWKLTTGPRNTARPTGQ